MNSKKDDVIDVEAEIVEDEQPQELVKAMSNGMEKLDWAMGFISRALSWGRGISKELGELGELSGGIGTSLATGSPVSKKQFEQLRPIEIEWTCKVCGYSDVYMLVAGIQRGYLDDDGKFSESKFRSSITCPSCAAPGNLSQER